MIRMKALKKLLVGLNLAIWTGVCLGSDPVVSNVRASQRAGTKLVDITYDAADSDGDELTVSVTVKTGGVVIAASSFTGDVKTGQIPAPKHGEAIFYHVMTNL